MGRTFIFLPPIKKTAGGVTVLRQLAGRLTASGREAFLAPWDAEAEAALGHDQPIVARDTLSLQSHDIWLVPEGWTNALAPGLSAGARCVVYCQNWAYLFSGLPDGAHWGNLPVEFLAVSHPVAAYIRQTLGRGSLILRPGIDREVFRAPSAKPAVGPGKPVRVAYMPRKNKAQALAVAAATTSSLHGAGQTGEIEFEPIENLDRFGVAEVLGRSHIFLATGFPEGCPLPPLEAMACGCLVAGFTGYGAWDYARSPHPPVDGVIEPWFDLRDVPWGANGLWTADADVLAAANALERAIKLWRDGGGEPAALLNNAAATAEAYDIAHQQAAVESVWSRLEQGRID